MTKITIEQAQALEHGTELHHVVYRNADGTPQRWRVNGQVKRWKRDPQRFKIPVKHGLYDYGYIENAELDQFRLTAEEALAVS